MPRLSRTCVVAYRPFHPLDFNVIDFMQVNDCEGGQREGATWRVHSRGRMKGGGRTRGGGADDGGGWSG